jgi:hypothetical protein
MGFGLLEVNGVGLCVETLGDDRGPERSWSSRRAPTPGADDRALGAWPLDTSRLAEPE